MVYILSFCSSKCSLFHNSNVFGSCIIHIIYTGCAKIKKISCAKRLKYYFVSECEVRPTTYLTHCMSWVHLSFHKPPPVRIST